MSSANMETGESLILGGLVGLDDGALTFGMELARLLKLPVRSNGISPESCRQRSGDELNRLCLGREKLDKGLATIVGEGR